MSGCALRPDLAPTRVHAAVGLRQTAAVEGRLVTLHFAPVGFNLVRFGVTALLSALGCPITSSGRESLTAVPGGNLWTAFMKRVILKDACL